MLGIVDIAQKLGYKVNTFRYWLKRNESDFNSGIYTFNLMTLAKRMKFVSKNENSIKKRRVYYKMIIPDKEKFIKEFENYLNFINEGKKKNKLYRSLNWTRAAFECYMSNFTCSKCFNNHICGIFTKNNIEPPMKRTVKDLLNKVGKPFFKEEFFY